MESNEIIGMVFGMMGMTFGLMAWIQIQATSKELADLKTRLQESGALKSSSPEAGE